MSKRSLSSRDENQVASSGDILRHHADELLYMTSVGRVTRRKHVVKLRFVRWKRNDSVCVLTVNTGSRPPDWLQNLLSSNTVRASSVASRQLFGEISRVSILIDPEDAVEARKRFFAKYGDGFAKEEATYYRNARPVVLDFVPLERPIDLINELEFDLQARRYTSIILKNKISRWQREATVGHILSLFGQGKVVLEIGCGTGIETLAVAKKGVNVVAVDISEEMLEVLDRRVMSEPRIKGRIRTRQLSSSRLSELRNDSLLPAGGFDGAYSDFGVPNLDMDLRAFSKDLSSLLKPRAVASFVVWNKYCVSESIARLVRVAPSHLRKRFSGFVVASEESKYSLDTRTYTPKGFASFFGKEFDLVSYSGLPVLIPPSEYSRKFSFLLKLRKIDLALGHLPLFRGMGDNFVITLRRRA